jgi:hypothetical protein
LAQRDRALHRADEVRIHPSQLLARPKAIQPIALIARPGD